MILYIFYICGRNINSTWWHQSLFSKQTFRNSENQTARTDARHSLHARKFILPIGTIFTNTRPGKLLLIVTRSNNTTRKSRRKNVIICDFIGVFAVYLQLYNLIAAYSVFELTTLSETVLEMYWEKIARYCDS